MIVKSNKIKKQKKTFPDWQCKNKMVVFICLENAVCRNKSCVTLNAIKES